MALRKEFEHVRLNLGCGADIRPGFINVDKFPANDSVVQADFPILPFADNYADEVVLSHVLEHFGYTAGVTLLSEIFRVVKVGGEAYIEVPDVAWCCAQFLGAPEPTSWTDPTMDYSTCHKWGLWAQALWGDQHNEGLFHKWGYTAHRLLNTLCHVGFQEVSVDFIASHGFQCLAAKAIKS